MTEAEEVKVPAKKRIPKGLKQKLLAASEAAPRPSNQIPEDILFDANLNAAIATLPPNYDFEIHKTVWRLRKAKSKLVALQFPEGLLMYALQISDILTKFCDVETLVMGDVTYGACCVDDFSARALGCDFLVHYGHSCLVPIDVSQIDILYVFVDIEIDVEHLIKSILHNFPPKSRLVLSGTIQFQSAVVTARKRLEDTYEILVPQGKPLSRGEVLGCTSPRFDGSVYDALIFVSDGRFHLESIMIQNPHIPKYYKFDPYNKALTLEKYNHAEMFKLRTDAIERAKRAKSFGLILGTLGRQGNPLIVQRLQSILTAKNIPFITVLLSEIFPAKLALMSEVDAWIQVACPRLSIDWGYAFDKPLLSSYEAEVAINGHQWQEVYPMDYYRHEAGPWANYQQSKSASVSSGPVSSLAPPIDSKWGFSCDSTFDPIFLSMSSSRSSSSSSLDKVSPSSTSSSSTSSLPTSSSLGLEKLWTANVQGSACGGDCPCKFFYRPPAAIVHTTARKTKVEIHYED